MDSTVEIKHTCATDLIVPVMAGVSVPEIISRAGAYSVERSVQFFTAEIRNPNTRRAYGRAAGSFFAWMHARGLTLEQMPRACRRMGGRSAEEL